MNVNNYSEHRPCSTQPAAQRILLHPAVQDYHDRVTRMTTYHAHGDTGQVDYSQLAAIVSARFDDYAYQILKNNDYALHCGMQAPRSVLLSAGGSWDHIPYSPHTSHPDSQQGW